jgi:GNAT superfamily N-acetyltransferase
MITVSPMMRRKGIATALLNKACEDAAAEGYSYVEAYPRKGEVNERSYHGPLSIYKKLGFAVHKELDDMTVVRKY